MDMSPACRTEPRLAADLERRVVEVQTAASTPREFRSELCAELAARQAACVPCCRVVPQCLYRCRPHRLLALAWQTRTCDAEMQPASAGVLRGVVDLGWCAWFTKPLGGSTDVRMLTSREAALGTLMTLGTPTFHTGLPAVHCVA